MPQKWRNLNGVRLGRVKCRIEGSASIVELQGGYDPNLIEKRRRIVDCIYNRGSELTNNQVDELRSLSNPI